jgi:hypothetical protein
VVCRVGNRFRVLRNSQGTARVRTDPPLGAATADN